MGVQIVHWMIFNAACSREGGSLVPPSGLGSRLRGNMMFYLMNEPRHHVAVGAADLYLGA